MTNRRGLIPALIAALLIVWTVALGRAIAAGGLPQAAASAPATAAPAKAAPAKASTALSAPQANEYIGEDTCLTCHEDRNYKGTRHALASLPKSPAATHGCESCHGPGKAHAESGGEADKILNPTKVTPQRASEVCATCHNRGEHAVWSGSQHDSRNVGCVSCHSVHAPKGPKQLKVASQPQLCATCHRDKIAKLDRSGHMPVREGKMQCTTCHNVHGSTNVRLLRTGDSIGELCTSCHAEKRGPFLWEHAPSRDGCTTCHDPHGSSNERMLVSKPPILCQRCHVSTRHPSTIYDAGLIGSGASPSIRIYARSCVTCHSAIHGSNHPSGQRFIR
jgi:DmsE family decaheme c-type cytochrome